MRMPSYLHLSRANSASLCLRIVLRDTTLLQQLASDMTFQMERDFMIEYTSHASSDVRQQPIWIKAMLKLSAVPLSCFLPPNKHTLLCLRVNITCVTASCTNLNGYANEL